MNNIYNNISVGSLFSIALSPFAIFSYNPKKLIDNTLFALAIFFYVLAIFSQRIYATAFIFLVPYISMTFQKICIFIYKNISEVITWESLKR